MVGELWLQYIYIYKMFGGVEGKMSLQNRSVVIRSVEEEMCLLYSYKVIGIVVGEMWLYSNWDEMCCLSEYLEHIVYMNWFGWNVLYME